MSATFNLCWRSKKRIRLTHINHAILEPCRQPFWSQMLIECFYRLHWIESESAFVITTIDHSDTNSSQTVGYFHIIVMCCRFGASDILQWSYKFIMEIVGTQCKSCASSQIFAISWEAQNKHTRLQVESLYIKKPFLTHCKSIIVF